jgi:hypothetical protein
MNGSPLTNNVFLMADGIGCRSQVLYRLECAQQFPSSFQISWSRELGAVGGPGFSNQD